MLDVCPIQPPAPVVAPLQAFYDEVRPASPKPMWVSLEAHHEAGHAVYGYRFGVKLKRVTIVPEGDIRGQVQPAKVRHHRKGWFEHPTQIQRLFTLGILRDPDLTPARERALRIDVELTLAGPLAAALRMGEEPEFPDHPRADGVLAREFARYYTGTDDEQEIELLIGWLTARVRRILAHPAIQYAVEQFATVLAEHQTLEAEQLDFWLDVCVSHALRREAISTSSVPATAA